MTPSRPSPHPCPALFDGAPPRRYLLTATRHDGTTAEVIVYAVSRNRAWDRVNDSGLYGVVLRARRAA